MISRFLQRQDRSPLRPLERKLIDALVAALSPEAGGILARQVELVNRVQRHASDKEVNLYRMHWGRPSREGVPLFPVAVPEVKLASITYAVGGRPAKSRVDLWVVNGRLFSLTFQQSPKGVDADDIEVRDVKLLADPMVPAEAAKPRPLGREALVGWVAEWAAQREMAGLAEPLPQPARERLLQQIEAELPSDYLDLVSQTEGLEINGCRVYGLAEVREVVMEDASYYILAEMKDRGVLAVRRGSPEAETHFLPYDTRGIPAGPSLREAVERLLRYEVD